MNETITIIGRAAILIGLVTILPWAIRLAAYELRAKGRRV